MTKKPFSMQVDLDMFNPASDAEKEYRRLLKEAGKLNTEEAPSEDLPITVSGKITAISSAVVNGNTAYYILLENNDKVFIAEVSLNDRLPFIKTNDTVTIKYTDNNGKITVTEIKHISSTEAEAEN